MESKKRTLLVYTLLTISMILWGTSFVWSKVALQYYNTNTIVFFRLILSALILTPVLIVTKKFKFPAKKHIPMFLLLALFEPFLYFLGETNGLKYLDPSMASVLISIIPLFTPFVAYLFLKDKITVVNLLGIVISIGGIMLLVFGKGMSIEVAPIGLALIMLAVVAANGYSVMIKKLPNEYSILNIIFWQNILGILYFSPIVALTSYNDFFVTGFVSEGAFAILKLGFFASTLAFLFYMYGLKFMSITKVNVFTNTIPIFTILVAWLILDEEIGMKKIVGILIVIGGVVISQIKYRLFKPKSRNKEV